MNVYFLNRDYESDVRVEVDDSVEVRVDSYGEGRTNGFVVRFEEKSGKYDTVVIAAFDAVTTIRKEGMDIQYEEYTRDPAEDKPIKPIKKEWVDASKKS